MTADIFCLFFGREIDGYDVKDAPDNGRRIGLSQHPPFQFYYDKTHSIEKMGYGLRPMKSRISAIKTDLFAADLHPHQLEQLGEPLLRMGACIDFTVLAAQVDGAAPRPVSAQGGRPPYPTEVMVRILVLNRLYNLSEEQRKAQGYRGRLQRKGSRNHPLSECQQRRNHNIAKVRARIAHVFAAIEQMGGKLIRTIGPVRASCAMTMMAVTYNIKRLTLLEKGPIRTAVCP